MQGIERGPFCHPCREAPWVTTRGNGCPPPRQGTKEWADGQCWFGLSSVACLYGEPGTRDPGPEELFGLLSIHLSIACSLLVFLPSGVSLCTDWVFLIWPWSLEHSSRSNVFERFHFLRYPPSPDRTTFSTFATHSPLWRRVLHHEHLPCANREIDLPLPGPQSRRHQARPGDSSI